jgi:hypothetical protein
MSFCLDQAQFDRSWGMIFNTVRERRRNEGIQRQEESHAFEDKRGPAQPQGLGRTGRSRGQEAGLSPGLDPRGRPAPFRRDCSARPSAPTTGRGGRGTWIAAAGGICVVREGSQRDGFGRWPSGRRWRRVRIDSSLFNSSGPRALLRRRGGSAAASGGGAQIPH